VAERLSTDPGVIISERELRKIMGALCIDGGIRWHYIKTSWKGRREHAGTE